MTKRQVLLTPAQAGEIFGVSGRTMSRWAREGRVPTIVLPSGHRRFRPEDLELVVTPAEERHERAYERRTA